jgi:hypothetical protein
VLGVLKKHGQYQLPLGDDIPAANCIKKVSHDFGATLIDDNIWGAFRCIGITYTTVADVQRVLFDEKKLRESDGFRELWDVDLTPGICGRDAQPPNSAGSTGESKADFRWLLSVSQSQIWDISI